MSELQPGMLAMITGSVHVDSRHIGKIVKLNDCGIMEGWGEYWNFEEPLDVFSWRALTKHLTPIKPEADPLEIKVNQELHA